MIELQQASLVVQTQQMQIENSNRMKGLVKSVLIRASAVALVGVGLSLVSPSLVSAQEINSGLSDTVGAPTLNTDHSSQLHEHVVATVDSGIHLSNVLCHSKRIDAESAFKRAKTGEKERKISNTKCQHRFGVEKERTQCQVEQQPPAFGDGFSVGITTATGELVVLNEQKNVVGPLGNGVLGEGVTVQVTWHMLKPGVFDRPWFWSAGDKDGFIGEGTVRYVIGGPPNK